MLFQCQFATHM